VQFDVLSLLRGLRPGSRRSASGEDAAASESVIGIVFSDAVILRLSCPKCGVDRLVYQRDPTLVRPVICMGCLSCYELGEIQLG